MPTLGLRLSLGSLLLSISTAIFGSSPPGAMDFSKQQNSGLLILLEDI